MGSGKDFALSGKGYFSKKGLISLDEFDSLRFPYAKGGHV
jgi:hypothetical protein